MELTYDNMVKFMEAYFPVYSKYGQDPATVHLMNDYFAPDLVFTGYMGFPEGLLIYPDRQAFLDFDVSHPWVYERLTPEDMTVDDRRKIVFVIIKFEFIDRRTGQVLIEDRGVTQYHLAVDENDSIKIRKLLFFPVRLVPGALSGDDSFAKDPQA